MTRAAISSAPSTEPITIPAIWPPVKPRFVVPAAAAPVAVLVGTPLDVELGKRGAIDEVVGRRTLVHLCSTPELAQQESVALGEEAAQ